MDRTKLLRIIQKDLEELNEITGDLTRGDEASNQEIEFALSKSRIICQEFEFLKELTVQPLKQKMAEYPKAEAVSEKIPGNLPPKRPFSTEIPIEKKQEVPAPPGEAWGTPGELVVPAEKTTPLATGVRPGDTPIPEQEYPQPETPLQNSATEEESTEESLRERTVGEFFIQGKSLNDLLSENKTLDRKLADSPVARLSQAIGLNDRFQFIRELFNNDADLFRQTVEQIDQMENRNEAVRFLSSNFKWRKSDTSLKFAQLVKRRFLQ